MNELNTFASDFTCQNQQGESISLGQFRGQITVLYFYPKDFTPGCTAQACSYRDAMEDFNDRHVAVLGISEDSVNSHAKFMNKHQLNYQLLSDENHQVASAYGVYKEKSIFGHLKLGIVRTTFILDKDHRIVAIFSKTDPKTDSVRVLAEVDRLLIENSD